MKCSNSSCRWLGPEGRCLLFAGAAVGGCKYRIRPGRAPAEAAPSNAKSKTTTTKGKATR